MSASKRIPALDTLRSLAILLVMPFHLGDHVPQALQPITQRGWIGVDLFFVLSGYLIGKQLLKAPPSLLAFYRNRAYRILPAYFAVLALYFLIPQWREAPGLPHLWQFLTFTLNLNIDYAHTSAFSHAWSLCVEEHFYLILPILAIALLKRPSIRRTAFVAGIVFAIGLIARTFAVHHMRLNPDNLGLYSLEHIYYPTWTHLDGLLFGVLLAATQLYRPLWWQSLLERTHILLLASIATLALALYLLVGRFDSAYGLAAAGNIIGYTLLALGFALLLVSSLGPRSILRHRIPGAATLAALSYSLYLSHKGSFHLIHHILLPDFTDAHPYASQPLYFATALVIAAALYLTIEHPFLKLRDRRTTPTT
jgi:peptidoglycan/LPS O-acetylase OafA/YrhL